MFGSLVVDRTDINANTDAIVEETATLRRYWPFEEAGFSLLSWSMRATRFFWRRSAVKEARPIGAWMIPALSARNWT